MMSETEKQDNQWQPCPRGHLSDIAVRLQEADQHSRRMASLRMATGMLLLLAVGASVTGLLWRKPQHGGITCQQCMAQFDTFQQQLRVGEGPMSNDDLATMQTHLRECRHCGPEFERRYPQAVQLFDAAGGAMLVARHSAAAAMIFPNSTSPY